MEALIALAILACPIGMGAMMLFMWKGMGGGKSRATGSDARPLPELKAEQARLAAKIDALEEERSAGSAERETTERV